MNKTIRIGTRASRLAVVQAELVACAIKKYHPAVEVSLVKIKSTGDIIQDKTLDQIGGKGVFVKELDEALRRKEVDICVHSYKDVTAEDETDLPIVAASPREDPRDVLILPRKVSELDPRLPVGCGSKRRQVQLARLYPGQPVAPVRGNVLTRLEKLDRGEFSALVLAAAGVLRLGLRERISRFFSPEELLPAVCQGVMAVQGRRGEDYGYLAEYNDPGACCTSAAERAFVRRLGCGCGAPVGVFGEASGDRLRLRGMIAGEDGAIRRGELSGPCAEAENLGVRLAEHMMTEGF